MADVFYRERQHLRSWPVVALLAALLPVSLLAGGLPGLVVGVVLAVVASARLDTEVRADGVYLRYAPFHRSFRRIPFADVRAVEATTYRPLLDYGGWGLRRSWRDGSAAYTTGGNRGVRIERRNDRALVVGSKRPEAFAAAVERAARAR